jgi:hypothetical protein
VDVLLMAVPWMAVPWMTVPEDLQFVNFQEKIKTPTETPLELCFQQFRISFPENQLNSDHSVV